MLYTKVELQDPCYRKIALERYLYKYTNHRKEIKRLKLHEKEFMFRAMNSIFKETGDVQNVIGTSCFESDVEFYQYLKENGLIQKAFNLYEIEEAHEYVFYKIVLTYYHNLNFLMPVYGSLGLLSKEEIQVDKFFFDYYYPIWCQILFSGKGGYMTHILPEYNRKYKILENTRIKGLIGYNLFKSKNVEVILACYHIYYKVRFFFDSYRGD